MTNLSEEFGCSPGLVSANGIQRRFCKCAHGEIFFEVLLSRAEIGLHLPFNGLTGFRGDSL